MTETIAYRKPKQMPEARAKHTESSRELSVFKANQESGIPSVLITELTGIPKATLLKVMHNTDTVPLEFIGRTDRFLAALVVAHELQVLPTSDYGVIRNVVALCYTVLNLEDDLEALKE